MIDDIRLVGDFTTTFIGRLPFPLAQYFAQHSRRCEQSPLVEASEAEQEPVRAARSPT